MAHFYVDTTLEANTTYDVLGQLMVPAGKTLTIPAGVTLRFHSSAWALTVNGTLKVQGTNTNRVRFTAGQSNPATGDWSGIIITSTATGVVIDNAIIEYAGNGLHFNSLSTGAVSNSLIRNNSKGVYVYDRATPLISAGNVITANLYGLYVEGGATVSDRNPHPVVTGNDIYGNSIANYYTYRFYSPSMVFLNARNNWWGSINPVTIMGTIVDYADIQTNSPVVDYSGFLNNAGGTPVPGNFLSGVLTADTPLMANTTYDVLGPMVVPTGITLTIPAGVTLRFYGYALGLTVNGTLKVQGSSTNRVTFTYGGSSPGKGNWDGIKITSTATGVMIDNAVIEYSVYGANFDSLSTGTVSNSQIRNNTYGVYVYDRATPLISAGNVITANTYGLYVRGYYPITSDRNPHPVVTGNDIYGNSTSNYYTVNFFSPSTVVLNARNNWWGSTNPGTIAGTIRDYTDSPSNAPVVDYGGYLSATGGTPVVGNSLVGVFNVDTTLAANTTYDVLGPLVVPADKTLTILAGVTLRFYDASWALTVDGSLQVLGTSTNRVRFTSGQLSPVKSNWYGIKASSTATGVVIDNAVVEYAYAGVYFNGTAVVDSGNCVALCVKNSVIQTNTYGFYLAGASKPTLTGNSIVYNTYGIYLSGSGSDATSPKPSITSNDIYGNTSGGLYLNNYSATSALIINATGNWWGRATPVIGTDIKFSPTSLPSTIVDYSNSATQQIHAMNASPTVTLTSPAGGSVFYAPAIMTLSATAADSDGTVSKVDFYNGTTLLGTATSPPYSYAWDNVAAGTYNLTAKATDDVGATTTSAPVSVTVTPTTVTVAAGINGAVINDDHMLVSGSFNAPPNTGVTVNGILATTVQDGSSYLYYANNVPLSTGSNTLTINLVSQDGQTATSSATVTSTGGSGYTFLVREPEGIVPFTAYFDYANNTTQIVKTLQIDYYNDGTIDSTVDNPSKSGLITVTFVTPWIYPMKIILLDDSGAVLYTSTQVFVLTSAADFDSKLQPIYTGMLSRLRDVNIAGALTAVTGSSYDKFNAIFTSLGNGLATAVDQLGIFAGGSFTSDTAEYSLLRTTGTETQECLIYFIRGEDGVWRIDGM